MKYHRLIILLTLVSSTTLACGVHTDTGFNFVTEPGSLNVFGKVIEVRQSNVLGNNDKLDYFKQIAINKALNKPHHNKINFNLFEAIKGHYSEVIISHPIAIQGLTELPNENRLLVITEVDVLDALATNVLSWQQAKRLGLVAVSGHENDIKTLNIWFRAVFPEPVSKG